MCCPKCGTQNDDNAFKCIKYETILQQVPPAAVAAKKSNAPVVILAVVGSAIAIFVVIGVLAAIAIPQCTAYRQSSYTALLESDAHSIATAQEAYFVDHNRYANDPKDIFNDKYGASISPGTEIRMFRGDKEKYAFDLVDTVHDNVPTVKYRSDAGGIQ